MSGDRAAERDRQQAGAARSEHRGYWPSRAPAGTCLLALVALGFSALVYAPITRNYFYEDDFVSLYRIANRSAVEYLFTPNYGHASVTRNAVFYLFARLFGAAPEFYYASVFLTHLVNVALLFWVIRELLGSDRLACFGATLWGTSPFNDGTLGWYSVYGHVMVATCLLIVLLQVAQARRTSTPPTRARQRLWYALALVAATSFGVGIAVAIVLPVILALLCPAPHGSRWRPPCLSLVIVVPALYVAQLWIYRQLLDDEYQASGWMTDWILPHWKGGFVAIWTLITRGLSAFPFGVLGGPQDPSNMNAVTLFLLGATALVVYRASVPIRHQLVAFLLLALSCLAVIALGRVMVLSSGSPKFAFARYYYVTFIALTIVICIILDQLTDWGRAHAPLVAEGGALTSYRARAFLSSGLLLVWLATTLAAYLLNPPVLRAHRPGRKEVQRVFRAVEACVEVQPPGAVVYIENPRFRSVSGLLVPDTQFPGWAAIFVILYPDNVVDDRRVLFVEDDPGVRESARSGKRTGSLFVPPSSAIRPCHGW